MCESYIDSVCEVTNHEASDDHCIKHDVAKDELAEPAVRFHPIILSHDTIEKTSRDHLESDLPATPTRTEGLR